MADAFERTEFEQALLLALADAGGDVLEMILAALGDPPDAANITSAMWADIEALMRGAVETPLQAAFVASAEASSAALGIGVSWDTVNIRAADWARQYSYDLVRGITGNSQTMLQQAVSSFFAAPTTNEALQDKIAKVFGAARAENIAVTEVTRAASAGEQAAVAELAAQGVRTVSIIQTSADDRVCAICGPMNGLRSDQAGFYWPPFHVKCRCGTRTEVILPEGV